MATYYGEKDARPELILGPTVAMIGYGNQGRPQALNLRDSGVRVVVGLAETSRSWAAAQDDGMEVVPTAIAAARGDLVMLCVPDTRMAAIYDRDVLPHLQGGKTLAFCHGFNVLYGLIEPPPEVDTVLIAPKGTGPALRAEYEAGRGVPALVAAHHDASGLALDRAIAYAWALGCCRSFLVETTFRDETVADLFGEQAVLCGGVPELIKSSMALLIEAGVSPEIAYFECLSDCKRVMDLLYERGFEGMRGAISDTAEWGGLTQGPTVVDESTRERLRRMLEAILDGTFAREWMQEAAAGLPNLKRLRAEEASSVAERAATEVRQRRET